MIILSTPDNLDAYIAVEENNGFTLQQKGYHPLFMDNGYLYFKRTNQLLKLIKKLKLDIEI